MVMLYDMPLHLQNEFEIVKMAVTRWGGALQYASQELQQNTELIALANNKKNNQRKIRKQNKKCRHICLKSFLSVETVHEIFFKPSLFIIFYTNVFFFELRNT